MMRLARSLAAILPTIAYLVVGNGAQLSTHPEVT
jgi:hypothetical protein